MEKIEELIAYVCSKYSYDYGDEHFVTHIDISIFNPDFSGLCLRITDSAFWQITKCSAKWWLILICAVMINFLLIWLNWMNGGGGGGGGGGENN